MKSATKDTLPKSLAPGTHKKIVFFISESLLFQRDPLGKWTASQPLPKSSSHYGNGQSPYHSSRSFHDWWPLLVAGWDPVLGVIFEASGRINISPEKCWLEEYFPFEMVPFQMTCLYLRDFEEVQQAFVRYLSEGTNK